MLQQSAESFLAKNATGSLFWRRPITTRWQMTDRGVRSTRVVEIDILVDEVIQMLLAEDDEVSQALVLQRLDYTFCVGVEVRRTVRQTDRFDAIGFEYFIEASDELPVGISDQLPALQVAVWQEPAEVLRLPINPGQRWMHRGRSHMDPPALDMDEQDQVELLQTFGSPSSNRQEVTRPQCLRMHLQELIPSSFTSKRIRSDPVALEDVLDGVAGEMDAELVEFAAKLRVAQACFVGDTNYQLLDRFRSLSTTYFVNGWSSSLPLTVDPSEERLRCDDRGQVFDSRSQWLSQTNKSSAFRWSDHDALGQPTSEYLIFGFEELNSVDELTFGGTEQCLKQRREEGWHLSSMAVFRPAVGDDTVFAPLRTLHPLTSLP